MVACMKIGKVAETVLKRSVFKQFQVKRDEVLIGPGIGEDCSVLKLNEDECFVMSSDPITGTSMNIGELAVHITLNDLAASGAEPVGLMVTLLLPDGYLEKDLKVLIREMNQVAKEHNVQIIGGHTEVTPAVNQVVVSMTGVGKVHKDKVMLHSKIKPGHKIVMTKWAGVEGTSILAYEGETKLKAYYNSSLVERAKGFSRYLSVVEDSKIAMRFNVYAMHDVTEGGIMGALWEIGSKSRLGIMADQDLIPLRQETIDICEYLDLNPYKLIGSGSMIIVTDEAEAMIKAFEKQGILATVIGEVTPGNHKQMKQADTISSLQPPKTDELYDGLERCK